MAKDKEKPRREFLEKSGGFVHMATVQDAVRASYARIEKIEDWEKVPNFFTGLPDRSDLVKQLTLCILQLQAEVNRLRRGQD